MTIESFRLAVPQQALDDLARRLDMTRWADRETSGDWSQGVPLEALQALVGYWRDGYDWRRCEKFLNGLGQFRTEIDGLGIHFLHIRSPEPDALPLIMSHGWPGSVIEFSKVIGPLTDPVAHGGSADEAFDLVIPSLPGYGFSDKPASRGWGVQRIAAAWIALMARLGYARWGAQGGDWGCAITSVIAQTAPPQLAGIHLNVPFAPVPADTGDFTPDEQAMIRDRDNYELWLSGYAKQQSTRPQTLAYGLTNSPVGQAAWIYDCFQQWTDNPGSVEDILTRDEILDNIMLYWLPGTAASSSRLYWESLMTLPFGRIEVPSAISVFPADTHRASRRWVEPWYGDLRHFETMPKGGHFAAFEQPDLFVAELRRSFASMR